MAAYSWLHGVSGDWAEAADWSGGVPNSSAANVTVAAAGTYTVEIAAAESFAAGSLNLDDASATLLIGGTLTLTRTLSLTAGALDLDGTIDGGTIYTRSGVLTVQTGVLNGVTVDGNINIYGTASNLTVVGGLTMKGTFGSGLGGIKLTGADSSLNFDGSQTLSNATILFGSNTDVIPYNDPGFFATLDVVADGQAATLTIAKNVNIVASHVYAQIYGNSAEATVVNDGAISATAYGGQFFIGASAIYYEGKVAGGQGGAGAFTNNGAVSASNGETLLIEPTVFTNSAGATLTAAAGSTLNIDFYFPDGGWSNAGTITADGDNDYFGGTWSNAGKITFTLTGGGTAYISGDFSNAGTITATGGTYYFDGTWSNAGTLDLTNANVRFAGTWGSTGTLDVTDSDVTVFGAFAGATLNQLSGNGNKIIVGVETEIANAGNVLSVGVGTALGSIALNQVTITGGTIADAGGGMTFDGATLDGVTYEGVVDLSEESSTLTMEDGVRVTGAGGSGAGTVMLTGRNGALIFAGGQTLDDFTIEVDGPPDNNTTLSVSDSGSPSILVFGKHLNVAVSGLYVNFDASSTNATIMNEGSISAAASAGYFELGQSLSDFINSGSLSVSNGSTMTIDPNSFDNTALGTITIAAGSTLNLDMTRYVAPDSWTNSGTITAAAGSTLTFGFAPYSERRVGYIYPVDWTNAGTIAATGAKLTLYGDWTNTGTIDVTDSTIYLGAGTNGHSLTPAQLNLFRGAGNTIVLATTLANSGDILSAGAGAALGMVAVNGGIITGGTIADSGGGFSFLDATLEGVAYQGTLDLSGAGSNLTIESGMTFAGADGAGAATIDLTGAGSVLDCAGTQTLDNATINIGSSGASGAELEASVLGKAATATLILGAKLDIVASGLHASILLTSATIVNDGAISATAAGGNLSINGSYTFTNNGSLTVSNGDTISIDVDNFSNFSGGTLTGGTYEADAGSVMQIDTSDPITTDDATIILSGTGSAIESAGAYLISTLTTIGATGVLKLLEGRNFTSTLALTDSGALVLGGSTFTAGGLTVAAGGSLSGSGAVAATIADSGLIEASGGTLTLQKAVTGTGGLQIDGGANLTLGSTLAAGGTATFNGANADLAITAVSSFADTIRGLAATDEIDLIKTAATKAVVNGSNQLVVTNYHTVVATFNLTGSAAGLAFTTESDNNGGTLIVAGAAPAPHASLHLFRQYVAAGFGAHTAPVLDRQDHLAMAGPHHDFAAGRV